MVMEERIKRGQDIAWPQRVLNRKVTRGKHERFTECELTMNPAQERLVPKLDY